jgi:hypothetical protein
MVERALAWAMSSTATKLAKRDHKQRGDKRPAGAFSNGHLGGQVAGLHFACSISTPPNMLNAQQSHVGMSSSGCGFTKRILISSIGIALPSLPPCSIEDSLGWI